MYRCHFTQNGRIVRGEYLEEAATLDAAIEAGRRLVASYREAERIDGFEIWLGAAMLYKK